MQTYNFSMDACGSKGDRPSPEAPCPHSLAESANFRFTVRFCL